MKKVAVLTEHGFEEIEALTIVDVMRRAGVTCDTISLEDYVIKGCHDIQIVTDYLITEIDIDDYDMVVLPGGLPGADNLMNSDDVVNWVRTFASKNKYVAAICAAPQILAKAGVISGKKVTSYPASIYRDLLKDGNYVDDIVVTDGNIITSRGPATALPFAYKLLDVLGVDSSSLRDGMLYTDLCEDIKNN